MTFEEMEKLPVNKIKDIEWEDINRLSRRELSKLVSKMGSAVNKRVKRIDKAGANSLARTYLAREGNISVAKKDVGQLKHEFIRAKGFLEKKTGSLKGLQEIQKGFESRVGGSLGPADTKTFWEAYNKLSEAQPASLSSYGSDQAQRQLREVMQEHPGLTAEDYVGLMSNHLREVYETLEDEEIEMAAAYDTESDFFELGEDL